ncbi:MAG: hypothetical protein HY512_02145 [Candidatus Aenigmarchaeota archaeon]|nr:hypothetical protein [Candidatus Aenigmarchaeota archaeon]
MKYVLMHHENEYDIDSFYREFDVRAQQRGVNLGSSEIIDRVASLYTDDKDSPYPEVVEFCKERDERIRVSDEGFIRSGRQPPKKASRTLFNTAHRIKELAAEQPVTIAYNDTVRTEVTARAVARVTGGNLVKGDLNEDFQVAKWVKMYNHQDGLTVIVTHQPAILSLIRENAGYSRAYFVETDPLGINRNIGLYSIVELW